MKKMLIAYATMSGNTLEVAELIQKVAEANGYQVTMYRVGTKEPIPVIADYDSFVLGTYTAGKGVTPKSVKRFVADIGYKPEVVYVFGTGDTQFGGDELFCNAAVKLSKFYNSPYEVLKVEQSPRGTQESIVYKWAEGVIKYERIREKHKCSTRS